MKQPAQSSLATPQQTAKIVLFSGHMIDHPQREVPRFPPKKVPSLTRRLMATLQWIGIGEGDVSISGAACGGDLMFVEAVLALGLRAELFLHTSVERHIKEALAYAGRHWIDLFEQVSKHPRVGIHILPPVGERPIDEEDPFVANNLWMMRTAMALGPERLHGILLWNGQGGDAPGGTAHMKNEMEAAGAPVSVVWED